MKDLAFNGRYFETGENVVMRTDYLLCFPSGEPVSIDAENGNLPCGTSDGQPFALWPSMEDVERYRDAVAEYETLTVHRIIGIVHISLAQDLDS